VVVCRFTLLLLGDQHFEPVERLFEARPRMDFASPEQYSAEFALRLRARETAMARLDAEGLFEKGDDRLRIVINVEVMPPDHTNAERALRLNPAGALVEWLEQAAESPWPSPAVE
jgi:hypothetical protein